MDLSRKIEKQLDLWKKSNSSLIMYGARQVGKTYILKKYIAANFKNMLYINLHNNIDAIKIIIGSIDIEDFLRRLSLFSNKKIDEQTCIFIDEIQEYYIYLSRHKEIEKYFDIIYQTKIFVVENKNRIVLSGSILRLELEHLITAPTGYLLQLEMFPLDFEEYLINNNIGEDIINIARSSLKDSKEVPDYIHDKFISLFNEYILVGGMPKAVSNYLDNKSFELLEFVHKEIEDFLIDDIIKYTDANDKLKVKEIYNLIPTELSNPTRKFIISDIPSHKKNNSEVLSFTWLNNAGITIPVFVCDEPTIPLITKSKRNQFKLFFEDVGLLSYKMFDNETKSAILENKINVNKGFIFENFVAQELHAHNFKDLYYYNSRKYGEVDFVLEVKQNILPIEVKSGKNNNYHRALNTIMDIKNYNLNKAIVLTHDNFYINDKLIYMPIYAISLLDDFKK